ncbi:MAG: caspase family protein [Burkholderiaceae bacterium]
MNRESSNTGQAKGNRIAWIRQICFGLFLPLMLGLGSISSASAANRLALVIGNSDYPQWPLVNPVNDANAVATKLQGLGFDVSKHLQLKRDDIGVITDAFLRKINPDDTVVFFYAGHGVQVGGQNFLLATDAKIRTEFDVHRNGIDFTRFLNLLERSRASVKLVFLDACRNNPFAQKLRGEGGKGLARVGGAPYGTLISFATQPGGVAADGSGTHGLYTEQLLAHIDEPGVPVELMLKRVSASTHRASNGKQRPWIEGSLFGDFVFKKAEPKPVVASVATDYSKLAWGFALDANTRAAFEAFLREYPKSAYSGLARIKIATLAREEPVDVAALSVDRRVDSPVADRQAEKLVVGSTQSARAPAATAQATVPAVPQTERKAAMPAVNLSGTPTRIGSFQKDPTAMVERPVAIASKPSTPVPDVKPAPAPKIAVQPVEQVVKSKPAPKPATRQEIKPAATLPAKPPVQVAAVDKSLTNRPNQVDQSAKKVASRIEAGDPDFWNIEKLNGKNIVSVSGAPFDIKLRVKGNTLVVDMLKWKRLPSDAEGGDNVPLRCGFFSSSLSVSADGSVSGSCSAGHLSVNIRGTVNRLVVYGSYLATGGVAQAAPMTVDMSRQ